VSGSRDLRSAAFTVSGAVLVAVGLFVSAGWPFVLGGFVLLAAGVASR
jgi:hypothetical protein